MRENGEPKLSLTVGRFSCYHIQNKYILFCHAFAYFFVIFIVFGRQNVAETSETNRWLRLS